MTLKEGVIRIRDITQTTITEDKARCLALIIITLTVCAMSILGRVIPAELLVIFGGVIGYYFGRGVTNGRA